MANARVDPKKSKVAIKTSGVSGGIENKVLDVGKNFVDNKKDANSTTSTSAGTAKGYNLYNNIRGFRFEMPDGWNDEDIGIFVTCCLEKKDDISNSNVDRNKIWADITQSGAKESKNPYLFTINSCLELSEQIRSYINKKLSILSDNEAFMKFHSDVKGLLPFFSDCFNLDSIAQDKDKSILKLRRLSYEHFPENSSVNKRLDNYSIEDHNDEEISQVKRSKRSRTLRGNRKRSKVPENKFDSDIKDIYNNQEVALEPSSNKSFNYPSQKQQPINGKEKEQNGFASNINSNKDLEKIILNKNTIKNSAKQKKKASHRRIMPLRLAKKKVTSYSLLSNRRPDSSGKNSSRSRNIDGKSESTSNSCSCQQQSTTLLSVGKENNKREIAENSPDFLGFDMDSEDVSMELIDKFNRTKNALARTNIANSDTMTNDQDYKIIQNCDMKRLNRKWRNNMNKKQDIPYIQENLRSKEKAVHADNTMKNLAEILVDCHGSIDKPTLSNIIKLVRDKQNNAHFSGLRNETESVTGDMILPATSLKDYNQITKHHITPFCELSKHSMNDGSGVSADLSEDICLANSIGTVKLDSFYSKLQDNRVNNPYSTSTEMSCSQNANQKLSTSTGNLNSTLNEITLDSASATLKKFQKELFKNQGSSVCVTNLNIFENNQFFAKIEDAQPNEWLGKFLMDFKTQNAWIMQYISKIEQEIVDIEQKKVLIIEKILEYLVKK